MQGTLDTQLLKGKDNLKDLQPATQTQMMNTALASYYAEGNVSPDLQVLNDHEMAYVAVLQNNEALYEYFVSVKDQLAVTLMQAKIHLNGRVSCAGKNSMTTAVKAASIIPIVGKISNSLSQQMTTSDTYNENMIRERLLRWKGLFQTEQVTQVCYLIAAGLTLAQRQLIPTLQSDSLSIYAPPNVLHDLFGENLPHKLKAEIDLKTVEAIILTTDGV
jgi:hypothetical protein